MTNTEENAERYEWLRDGKSSYGGWRGSAPYVILPKKSILYAIYAARQSELDLAVDQDKLYTKINELEVENHLVETGIVSTPVDRFSEEYSYLLMLEAGRILGWSEERIKAADSYAK